MGAVFTKAPNEPAAVAVQVAKIHASSALEPPVADSGMSGEGYANSTMHRDAG
jgi:hypothetical protein